VDRRKKKEAGVLKKLMVVAAMLALALVIAVPAVAQIGFGAGQGIGDTGNVELNTAVTSSGDNGSQCVAPLQFANTGNTQNAQGFLQYNSTVDDVEFSGSSFTFTPSLTNTCEQTVQQAAAAGN
jgi:hypothetical protein